MSADESLVKRGRDADGSPPQRGGDADGSPLKRGGDANYGRIGRGYTRYRREEPAIAAVIERKLGDAVTVVNVGAGAGSYEPRGRVVTAVEPSPAMRSQRPAGLPPAVDAVAESLPFADGAFDGGMSTFSVHQWGDLERGIRELRRVVRGPVVILTCDPGLLDRFWLVDYAPEVIEVERRRYPTMSRIVGCLESAGGIGAAGGAGDGADAGAGARARVVVESVPVPLGCVDGFGEAYYGRPEALLDPGSRRANSAWSFVSNEVHARFERELARDLADGTWDSRYGALRSAPSFEGSLVAVYSPGR